LFTRFLVGNDGHQLRYKVGVERANRPVIVCHHMCNVSVIASQMPSQFQAKNFFFNLIMAM